MLYFYDTEFDESGPEIKLISIGIVREDGKEYYAESSEFDAGGCNVWVKQFVLPKLGNNKKTRGEIRKDLDEFFRGDDSVLLVAYQGSYDHIILNRLWGPMSTRKKGFPHYTWDLKQKIEELRHDGEVVKLPKNKKKHHALADARWVRVAVIYLIEKHGISMPTNKGILYYVTGTI